MKKEKKQMVERATDYVINGSTIANGLKALYMEASSSILQLNRFSNRLNAVFLKVGATTKDNPELGALKNFYDAIKRANYFFDEFISKTVTDATWGSNEGRDKVLSYDSWIVDSNVFARLTLLFFDRAYHDEEQQQRVFGLLENMESHGQFDENDFNYFK